MAGDGDATLWWWLGMRCHAVCEWRVKFSLTQK
jgi:hypothetical protein